MAIKLYQDLHNRQPGQTPQQPTDYKQSFFDFASKFQGNPETIGKQFLANGTMSKEQFNFCSSIANKILGRQ